MARTLTTFFVCTLAAAAMYRPAAVAAQFKKPTALLPDPKIRKLATKQVTPIYPASAASAKITGVAVAHILVEPDGHVQSIELLQAPNAAIGRAMVAALKGWRFPTPLPQSGDEVFQRQGTVVYYFLIQNGKPAVLSPAQAPVIGPKRPGVPHQHPDAGAPSSPDS